MEIGKLMFVALAYLHGQAFCSEDCSSENDIPYMTERLVGYVPGPSELNISDFYMNEDWYSMPGFTLTSNSSSRCGTRIHWYMNDSRLPSENETITKIVCVADGTNCSYSKEIRVKYCSATDYRFELPPTDASDEAYCIESLDGRRTAEAAPDVDYINPEVIAKITKKESSSSRLVFVCSFILKPVDRSMMFTVEWSITDTTGRVKHLRTSTATRHDDVKFNSTTQLTEDDLIGQGINKLGFNLSCSVRAKASIVGKYSDVKTSKSKFCGIKISPGTDIIIKGSDKVVLGVELTVPFSCSGSSTTCTYDVFLFVPKSPVGCTAQTIATANIDRSRTCGVRFQMHEVGLVKNITVTNLMGENAFYKLGAEYNVVLQTRSLVGHTLFTNYIPGTIRIFSEVDYNIISTARTYAHSDPHIVSFDQSTFDVQESGTFLLYRNSEYNTEVHTRHTTCYDSNSIFCNEAVAIRVGRDVYVIDINTRQTAFTLCDDAVLAGKIRRDDANTFISNGAEIKIIWSKFLEIDITPGIKDYGKLTVYVESLIRIRQMMKITQSDAQKHTTYAGKSGPTNKSIAIIAIQAGAREIFMKNHAFRPDTIQAPMEQTESLRRVRREATVLNFESAYGKCTEEMNTTSVQMCSSLPGLDVKSYFHDCAKDLMATNSYDWVQVHIEGLKQKCIRHVEIRQPLDAEVLKYITVIEDNNITDANMSQTSEVFTNELLQRIQHVSCSNDCSNQGVCVRGQCHCNSDHIGFDCSVAANVPPDIIGIPDSGLCDLSKRPCEQTMVVGRNFVESEKLNCRIVPIMIYDGFVARGKPETVKADLDTFVQVLCKFPRKTRKRREVAQFDINIIATGYAISISNNGDVFSVEDSIVIFDSMCVSCMKQNGSIVCDTEPGFCAHQGRCFKEGELMDCYTCQGATLNWHSNCDSNSKPSNKKYWIIGVVLGVIAVLCVAAAIIKKKYSSKASVIQPNTSILNDEINGPGPVICQYEQYEIVEQPAACDKRRFAYDNAKPRYNVSIQRPASALSREDTLGNIVLFDDNN